MRAPSSDRPVRTSVPPLAVRSIVITPRTPLAFLALTAAALPALAQGDPPENVLVLLADDVGVDYMASYGVGSDPATTPNIDALAAGGVRFENVWASPVCAPSRARLLTGRHGFRTGVGYLVDDTYALPLSEVTLPEMLDLGASTAWGHAFFGKWHLGNGAVGGDSSPNLAGWSHFAGTMSNLELPPDDFFSFTRVVDGAASVVNTYATTATVDDALAWLATAPEPWLCFVSFHAAHTPLHAPPASLHTVHLKKAGPKESDPVPYYRAMIEAVDTEIGRLLAGVGPSLDQTSVIFLGDNGTPSSVVLPPFDPEHSKGRLYEGGIRVPMIVSGPRVVTPGVSEALVNATDLFATVAEIAGVDPQAVLPAGTTLDSVSFAPYLGDPTLLSIRRTNFSEVFLPNGPDYSSPVDPPLGPLCQTDLGLAGPGEATLSICGGALVDGIQPELVVSGAPPGAPLWIIPAISLAPIPILGGTLGPNPPIDVFAFTADGNGEFRVLLKGGVAYLTIFVQAVVLDESLPGEPFAFTNTLQTEYFPPNTKAIRDQRYKLISSVLGGPDEFYDLEVDPLETNDLVVTGMSAEEQTAYDSLKQALVTLVTTP